MRAVILAVGLALIAPAAGAQTSVISYGPQVMVSLELSAEGWVETRTARTELAIDASLPGGDAGKVRGEMQTAIDSLAPGADWRFTTFNHTQDTSGLEQWRAVLEARLPEAQLGGLADRAKQASRAGLQIKLQDVDFSPTLAETETAKAKLRDDLYKNINDALAQLNQAEPDRKYWIQSINFNAPVNYPGMLLGHDRAGAAGLAPAPAPSPVERSEKIRMNAIVQFAAHTPQQ